MPRAKSPSATVPIEMVQEKADHPLFRERKTSHGVRRHRKIKLLAWVRQNCNGNIHYIGLTTKGQLIFSHHTIKDLEQRSMLIDFGDMSCKCAGILRAWREGKYSPALPFLLSRERQVWSTFDKNGVMTKRPASNKLLAHRLLQKRRLKRNIDAYRGQDHPLPACTMETLNRRKWTRKTVHGAGDKTAEAAVKKIIQTLQSWGWNARALPEDLKIRHQETKDKHGRLIHKKTLPPATQCGPYFQQKDQYLHTILQSNTWTGNTTYSRPCVSLLHFQVVHSEPPFVRCFLDSSIASSAAAIIRSDGLDDWDLRYLADMAEYMMMAAMIRQHNLKHIADIQEELTRRAAILSHELDDESFDVSLVDEDQALFSVKIEFNYLPLLSSTRLLQKIQEITLPTLKVAKNRSGIVCKTSLQVPPPPRKAVSVLPYKAKESVPEPEETGDEP